MRDMPPEQISTNRTDFYEDLIRHSGYSYVVNGDSRLSNKQIHNVLFKRQQQCHSITISKHGPSIKYVTSRGGVVAIRSVT